jgi:hypothetical protein
MKAKLINPKELIKSKGGESNQGIINFTGSNGAKRASMKIKNRGIRAQEESIKRKVLKDSGVEVPKKGKKKSALSIGGTEGIPAMKAILINPSEVLSKSRLSQPVGSLKMYGGRDFIKNAAGKWVLAEHKSEMKPVKEAPSKQAKKPVVKDKESGSKSSNGPKVKHSKVIMKIGSNKESVADGSAAKSNVHALLDEYYAAKKHMLKIESVLEKRYGTTIPLARKILSYKEVGAKE